jgi:exodeoxyribonuclease VII large subunit
MSQLPLFVPAALTVSELTHYLRELLEGEPTLGDLWIQGEVSNFSRPSSGHLYFTLKDAGASLRCVMWRNTAIRQAHLPTEGEAIEVHGYISIYDAGGQYQLYADLIRPLGEGLLYQEFLRLKARLEAEGLFDLERKRPLPRWPQRVGIVTSPTGAAVRDILNTLARRYPLAEVILAPTPVQGVEAPPGIIAALQNLNQLVHPDVILLARGGGSLEDLWAFNDEGVVRAIAASQSPVITGIGHETDFTLADFVSDLRAPTPTAAAELATPNQADLRIDLDDHIESLIRTTGAALEAQRWMMNDLKNRLSRVSPLARLQSDRQRLDEFIHRVATNLAHRFEIERTHLHSLQDHLESLNPMAVLKRGYAIVSRQDGQRVTQTTQVKPGDLLTIQVSNGNFSAEVTKNKGV